MVPPRDVRTEEDVKIKVLLPLLRSHGYSEECCEFERSIEVQEGRKQKTIYADVVVHASPRKDAPLILCETKGPTDVLDRSVREAAISYARLLPRIAPLALITNGSQVQVYQTLNKNRIPALPRRDALQSDVVNFIVGRELQESLRTEAKHELFIIDDVQTFKGILKACHNEIRNNEGYDPTQAFDEMSKVLFCKLYEEKHNPHANRFRTSVFDDSLERLGVNVVNRIFDETKTDEAYRDLFPPDAQIELQDRTARRIVALFEDYDLSLTAFDVKGEAFEYFLGDTFTGGLGEYFTPRNVVEFVVDAADPRIGEKVIDPFCGTGGFLIYAFEVVSEKIRLQEFSAAEKERWRHELSNRSLYGTDWKERTSQACKMNMMVHGDGSAGIHMHHGLVDVPGVFAEGEFDLCLTNPPFGSFENDPDVLRRFALGSGRKSQDRVVLAVERALRLVRPGGRVGIIVIDGILNNPSAGYRQVRQHIRERSWVRAVVSIPQATFEGYGSRAKTSILLLEKKEHPDAGQQEPVFMAVVGNTGYAPNGDAVPGNELPDVLVDLKAFLRGETDFGQHDRTWVAALGERLDAEFYWPRSTAARRDLGAVQADVSAILELIAGHYRQVKADLASLAIGGDLEAHVLSELFEEVRVREPLEEEKPYRVLGIHHWGKGAYVRDERLGRQVKAASLNRVSAGWLVYNRLFAYRGSFAVLGDEHDGCHVSNEFPSFRVRDGWDHPDLIARYVAHCMNSPQYLHAVDAQSTGSTKQSRNRFNQKRFLALSLPIPSSGDLLQQIVRLFQEVQAIRSDAAQLQQHAEELYRGIGMLLPGPDLATP